MQRKAGSNDFAVFQPSPVPQEKKTPPPVKPKPGSASSSIKEKQLPLLSVFRPEGAPPASPAPHAPPLPPPTPEAQGRQESTGRVSIDLTHVGFGSRAGRGWGWNQPRRVMAQGQRLSELCETGGLCNLICE